MTRSKTNAMSQQIPSDGAYSDEEEEEEDPMEVQDRHHKGKKRAASVARGAQTNKQA